MFQRCPKCGHHPLPADQALPAACPGCGVILAKLAESGRPLARQPAPEAAPEDQECPAPAEDLSAW